MICNYYLQNNIGQSKSQRKQETHKRRRRRWWWSIRPSLWIEWSSKSLFVICYLVILVFEPIKTRSSSVLRLSVSSWGHCFGFIKTLCGLPLIFRGRRFTTNTVAALLMLRVDSLSILAVVPPISPRRIATFHLRYFSFWFIARNIETLRRCLDSLVIYSRWTLCINWYIRRYDFVNESIHPPTCFLVCLEADASYSTMVGSRPCIIDSYVIKIKEIMYEAICMT